MNHKITLVEDDSDLANEGPAEIDFTKVRLIRRGLPPSHPLANAVPLDPEIVRFFKTPEAINQVLREVMNERRSAA